MARLRRQTLNDKEMEWARLYLRYGENANAATREVFYSDNPPTLMPKTVRIKSAALLRNPIIMSYVEEIKEERKSKIRMDKDAVVEEMYEVAQEARKKNPAVYEKIMGQINRILGNFGDEKEAKISSGGFTIKIELDNGE